MLTHVEKYDIIQSKTDKISYISMYRQQPLHVYSKNYHTNVCTIKVMKLNIEEPRVEVFIYVQKYKKSYQLENLT